MAEKFPLVTTLLSFLIITTFIFTTNFGERIFNPKAESRLEYYEDLLGFIPARPKIYSLITYTFIHVNLFHLLGNLVVLIIMGLALEKHLGKIPFLAIYISSGCTAATFDIINRLLLGISMQAPFVGSSGAIFGLVAVASLTRPMEKIPTTLVLFSFLPLIQFVLGVLLTIFTEQASLIALSFFLPFFVFALLTLPSNLPISLGATLFILSWVAVLTLNLPVSTSNIGHLGGFLGGILSIFIFPKKK